MDVFSFRKHMLAACAHLLDLTVATLQLNLFRFIVDLNLFSFSFPFGLLDGIVRFALVDGYFFECHFA
ncbi:hypothetical protein D3C76_1826990 [compost metagenome]